MFSFKRHISRSTLKLKRSIGGQKYEDERFDAMFNSLATLQKALTRFVKHVSSMTQNLESQLKVYRSYASDVSLMYSSPVMANTSGLKPSETDDSTAFRSSHDNIGLCQKLECIVEQMESQVVTPFISHAREIILQRVQEYRNELHQVEKSDVLKRRRNALLDYEIIEKKFHALQSKQNSGAQTEKELSDLSHQYETTKEQFEELDKKAKDMLSHVILKRYSDLYATLIEYFGEMTAEYHSKMADLGQMFHAMRSLKPLLPLSYELLPPSEEAFIQDEVNRDTEVQSPEFSSITIFSKPGPKLPPPPLIIGDKDSSLTNVDLLEISSVDDTVASNDSNTLPVSPPPESRLSRALTLGGPSHTAVDAPFRPKSLEPYEEPPFQSSLKALSIINSEIFTDGDTIAKRSEAPIEVSSPQVGDKTSQCSDTELEKESSSQQE